MDVTLNPYAMFVRQTIDCMSVNLKSIGANAKAENLWLKKTHDLNEAWTSGTNTDVENFLKELAQIKSSEPNKLTDWLSKAFTDLTLWSAQNIADAMKALGGIVPPPDGEALTSWNTARTSVMNGLQGYNGVLTAQQTSDTSTGDTEGKAMASVIQNITSQQTPIKDACDAFIGVLNAFASLLSSV